MRIKKDFILRNICGENIVIAEGHENVDFCKIISLNESAAYLWQAVADREFNIGELAVLLAKEYDVNPTTAHDDAAELAGQWVEAGIAE